MSDRVVEVQKLEKTYVHTWSWFVTDIGKANVVMFSSGFGDGSTAWSSAANRA